MSKVRRRIRVGFWTAIFSVVLLLAVLSQRDIPEQLTPFVTTKGRFTGAPIRLATPKGRRPEVAATTIFNMDHVLSKMPFELEEEAEKENK